MNKTLNELVEGIEQRDMMAIKDCFSFNSSFYSSLVSNVESLLSAYQDIHIVFDVADTRLHDAGKRMTLVAWENLDATARESKHRV